jgi:flagellar protein FlbD
MIELTRLNGNAMVLNSDLIKTVESSPDTMLTLINGEKLIVREEAAQVVERVLAYRARLLSDVSRKLPDLRAVQRVTGLASLDEAGLMPSESAQPASGRWGAAEDPGAVRRPATALKTAWK